VRELTIVNEKIEKREIQNLQTSDLATNCDYSNADVKSRRTNSKSVLRRPITIENLSKFKVLPRIQSTSPLVKENRKPLLKLANYDRNQPIKSVTPLVMPYQSKGSRSSIFVNDKEGISKNSSEAYGLSGPIINIKGSE